MKVKIIRLLTLINALCFLLCALCFTLCACGGDDNAENTTKLSFKASTDYETLAKLDGTTVTINGYLATSSPADGSFIFLMNLPFQSCPFCVPNTSQLANTMEVYPKKNQTFSYTSSAVKVTGTLSVAEEGNNFTDEYGYEFAFKIVDAEYKILKDSDIEIDVTLWNKIADSDIINDIYSMFDYLHFVSHWPTYSVNSYTDKEGNTYPGYYLWPSDVTAYLENEDAQFNYGYVDGYFQGLVSEINKIDSENLKDLVSIVEKGSSFAEKSLAELENGNYTYENMYIEEFETTDDVYTLTNADALDNEYWEIYDEFSNWINSWEM